MKVAVASHYLGISAISVDSRIARLGIERFQNDVVASLAEGDTAKSLCDLQLLNFGIAEIGKVKTRAALQNQIGNAAIAAVVFLPLYIISALVKDHS